MKFKRKGKNKVNPKNKRPFDMYIDYFFKRERNKNPSLYENRKLDMEEFHRKTNAFILLGHSTVLFKMDGRIFITDPVLRDGRVGPLGIGPTGSSQIGEGAEDSAPHEEIHDDEAKTAAGSDVFNDRAFAATAGKGSEKEHEKEINEDDNQREDPRHGCLLNLRSLWIRSGRVPAVPGIQSR